MKTIFLFDMDGTLTLARGSMDGDVEDMFYNIQRSGYEIGIISGSDMNYIKDQCKILMDMTPIRLAQIHFLPCNGTKYFKDGACIYSNSMREIYTKKEWHSIMSFIITNQNRIMQGYHQLPLNGHFIDYRGSMINWCPIGRSANHDDRNIFKILDSKENIRYQFLEHCNNFFTAKSYDLECRLGGDTSFDIFPTGWDKTYPLEVKNLFDGWKKIFVGDRCEPHGNDYELYKHPCVEGYRTNNPAETIEIVTKILNSFTDQVDPQWRA